MTQRIFDIENEKDMQDLWSILPDYWNNLRKIEATSETFPTYITDTGGILPLDLILIEWHNKTEITRPIQEATEADIGKLCYFWGDDENDFAYGILGSTGTENGEKYYNVDTYEGLYFEHARRLTKQEIKELC